MNKNSQCYFVPNPINTELLEALRCLFTVFTDQVRDCEKWHAYKEAQEAIKKAEEVIS